MDHVPPRPSIATADVALGEELHPALGGRWSDCRDGGHGPRGAACLEHRAGRAGRRRPGPGGGRALAAASARCPGGRVVTGGSGRVPRRVAAGRGAGRRAAGRDELAGRAAHRPRRGRPRRGDGPSGWWAAPAVQGRPRSPARSGRWPRRAEPRSWSTSTRSVRAATGCSDSTTPPASGGTRWRTASGRLSARSLREAAAAPGRPGGAGLGTVRVRHPTPARSARRSRRRGGATTSWCSTCPATRRRRGGGRSARCDHVVLVVVSPRSPGWPPRPGWPRRCPTRAALGLVVAGPRCRPAESRGRPSRCAGARHDGATSAGWPRRSTSGWGRCAHGAVRWPGPPRGADRSPSARRGRMTAARDAPSASAGPSVARRGARAAGRATPAHADPAPWSPQALRDQGRPVGDATVLAVHDAAAARRARRRAARAAAAAARA